MNRNNHGRGLAQRPPAPAPAPQGQGGTDGAGGQTHSPCCPQSWGAWGRAGGPQQTYRQTHSPAKPHGHQASLATKPPRGRSSAQGSYKPRPCAAPLKDGDTASSSQKSLPGAGPPAGCCSPSPGSVPAARWHRRCPWPRGAAWLLCRRCVQRPPLHSNTARGWGARGIAPSPARHPGAEVGKRTPSFRPEVG